MTERELIEQLRVLFAQLDERVQVGIGDDAAVLAPLPAGAVISVDASVEGVHFERGWLSLHDVGFRAYVAALSDLAAMGAHPTAGLLSLILPADLKEPEVLELVAGVGEAASRYDAPIAGGNLSRGAQLSVTSTVIGSPRGGGLGPSETPLAAQADVASLAAQARVLRRDGATAGDAVFVTGTVGAAALGWRLLRAGRGDDEGARVFVERWRRPRARFDVVDRLLDVATACIDVSDGLVRDLGHVARASGVAISIDLFRVPIDHGLADLAALVGEDPAALALAGGEDYELAFTAPSGSVDASLATEIGRVAVGSGAHVFNADGTERVMPYRGHDHF